MLAGFHDLEFDFVADNPGSTLFHCHQHYTWISAS
ncbi:MAG: hypothetical protein ACREU6_09575 [Steroidobacteraceae bacterium]